MSSPDDDHESPSPLSVAEQARRKKKQRACDYCRRKKIRCDGAEMPEHQCSRCISQGIECTYEPVNTRPPSKSYVQILENRLQNMEKLFGQLHPNLSIPKDFDSVLEANRLRAQAETPSATSASSPSRPSAYSSPSGLTPRPPEPDASVDSDELDPSDDERQAKVNILRQFRHGLAITPGGALRYHGKSSNLMFLQTVMELKDKVTGMRLEDTPSDGDKQMRDQLSFSESGATSFQTMPNNWSQRKEVSKDNPPHSDFPPRDLINQLADAYWDNLEMYTPLLHRPTFDGYLDEGKHLTDRGFGSVVLLSGWHWFERVDQARWSVLDRPKLEDLQVCVLTASYLVGTHSPQSGWNIIGLGIRLAQDVGCHRKKMYKPNPSVEDELWKRAFWCLLAFDRMGSFGLGRPAAIHDEDFDTEPLLEVDDEYWLNDDPGLCFKQPEGKPSRVAFTNCFARLQKILTFASRTVYSINKSKLSLGYVGANWEQRIVADLDSALNRWIDTIPEHLKWENQSSADDFFMGQSSTLYSHYYFAQICVHRPFIPSPNKPSRLPFPSLTICTNAARSCTHVLDIYFQRTGRALTMQRLPLFTAGLVLLLNMWGSKKAGLPFSPNMDDVQKCVTMLKSLQGRAKATSTFLEILNTLVSIGDFNMPKSPQPAPPPGPSNLSDGVLQSPFFRNTVTHDPNTPSDQSSPSTSKATNPTPSPNVFSLPMHTADLGRVGVYSTFATTPRAPQMEAESFQLSPQQMEQTRARTHMSPGPSLSQPDQGIPELGFARPRGYTVPDDNIPMPQQLTQYSELLAALSAAPATPGSGAAPAAFAGHANRAAMAAAAGFPMDGSGFGGERFCGGAAFGGGGFGGAGFDGDFGMGGLGGGLGMHAGMAGVAGPASADTPPGLDADVAMMSVEGFAFPDATMDAWNAAPTSFEWDDWGAYLDTMGGVQQPQGFEQPQHGAGMGL
ncbi:fungal-specific transcription factor domain-containing protein [Epithele typhae]|uniref:fungal-specific transcription factor domain-containing protein n=1 Tax=Epithele typhae TaxID=378194 RepID=UPI002007788E|nr:fungal-specific transcription factor domain-containing protein [Epithele typhae]KAH9917920.1 fungal-specific transcription factor domain-containing protein [Epithele typhae]